MSNIELPIIYKYFGDYTNNNHHTGVICVASQLNKDKKLLKLGASFCSPKDIFLKDKAKTIAKGRLLKEKTCFHFHFAPSFKINHDNLNKLIVQLIDLLPKYPRTNWSKKLVNQILKEIQ